MDLRHYRQSAEPCFDCLSRFANTRARTRRANPRVRLNGVGLLRVKDESESIASGACAAYCRYVAHPKTMSICDVPTAPHVEGQSEMVVGAMSLS